MVEQWVRDLVERIAGGSKMEVGATLPHPSGRTVRITGGQYWAPGGFSNFWYWREVLPDGTLSETEEHGYGWC